MTSQNFKDSHRTSSSTYFYKYVFPIMFTIGFLSASIFIFRSEDPFLKDWQLVAPAYIIWALFWLGIMMVRLRTIEANSDNIVVQNFSKADTVDYRDIYWINQLVLISPTFICIKYKDKNTGKRKSIVLIPQFGFKNSFEETEMTKFIRARVIESNSGYLMQSQSTRWIPCILIFLSSLVVTIINYIFIP